MVYKLNMDMAMNQYLGMNLSPHLYILNQKVKLHLPVNVYIAGKITIVKFGKSTNKRAILILQ